MKRYDKYIILKLCFDLCCMTKLNMADSDLIKYTAQTYCPFNDFCTFNKTSTFVDYTDGLFMPCCSPCSCDESCWMLDTCCPDIPTTRPLGHEVVTCKSSVFEYTGRVNPNYAITGKTSLSELYQVIDKCPPDYNGNMVTLNKCINATQIKPDTLHDIVIVSDAGNHNRVFMNRHCAECHGVTAIKRWDIESWACDLPIFEVSLGPSELFNFILTRCNLVSLPPNDLVLYASPYCRHESDFNGLYIYIDTCNVTGEWRIYDADVERACLFSRSSFFSEIDPFVFRNIFCFICNNAKPSYMDDTCNTRSSSYGDFEIGFSSMLDINIGHPAVVEVRDDRCDPVEIHDSISKVCRRVNCPINSSPFYGECIPNTRNLHKLTVTVILKLIPDQLQKIENELKMYDRKTYTRYVPSMLSKLGLIDCYQRCHIEARVYVDNNRNLYSVNVKIVLGTVKKCDLDFLIRWLDTRVQGTNILMPINGKGIGLTVHVDSETEFETENDIYQQFANGNVTGMYFGKLFKSGFFMYYVCPKSEVMLNGEMFCPYLIFNKTENGKIENHVMLIQASLDLQRSSFYNYLLPMFVQVELENGTKGAAICLEDYQRHYTKTHQRFRSPEMQYNGV